MKKHVIWSNDCETIAELEEDIREHPDDFYCDPEDEMDVMMAAEKLNDYYLDDERACLNVDVGSQIILIGDLGLWYGRRMGYRELNGTMIKDCLDMSHTTGSYITWYVDERGDLMCEDVHHDGTNYYTYRAWKAGLSGTQMENFLDKVYSGKATRADITRYTRKLGPYLAEVYGWR